MKSVQRLYIDESGVPDHNHRDKNYTVCGIVARMDRLNEIKVKADQIKFKYWGNTNIVFHSREIHREVNSFSILKDSDTKRDFYKDLYAFLRAMPFRCIVASVNKKLAAINGWSSSDVQAAAFDEITRFYVRYLDKQSTSGQILMESAGGKDVAFLQRYSHFKSQGIPQLGLDHNSIKTLLTSISFVSKRNHDIETQLADLFAYPASQQFLHDEEIKTLKPKSYEDHMCKILSMKLLRVGSEDAKVRIPKTIDHQEEHPVQHDIPLPMQAA